MEAYFDSPKARTMFVRDDGRFQLDKTEKFGGVVSSGLPVHIVLPETLGYYFRILFFSSSS